jgi:hypothetical protein
MMPKPPIILLQSTLMKRSFDFEVSQEEKDKVKKRSIEEREVMRVGKLRHQKPKYTTPNSMLFEYVDNFNPGDRSDYSIDVIWDGPNSCYMEFGMSVYRWEIINERIILKTR